MLEGHETVFAPGGDLSVDRLRTNGSHIPLVGNGDGGIYTTTVISNWSEGAWPIIKLLDERLAT